MHAVSIFQTSSTKSPPTDGDIRLLFAEVDFGYGDLTAVYRRDCKKLRGFAYRNHIMVKHNQPDGLVSRYEYDHYEPLAQVRNWTNEDGESCQQTPYFHCDQIGIPREITDKNGNLLWYFNDTGWGRLKKDERVYKNAHPKKAL